MREGSRDGRRRVWGGRKVGGCRNWFRRWSCHGHRQTGGNRGDQMNIMNEGETGAAVSKRNNLMAQG